MPDEWSCHCPLSFCIFFFFFWWYKPGTRTPSLPNFSIAEDKCSYHSFSTVTEKYSYFSYPWRAMKGGAGKRKRLGLLIFYFLICGGISCFLRALFWLISLKARKREKTLIFTRYTHSQIFPFVCVEASPGVTGVGNFCSAYLRLPWGYLATTNGSFSSAGYNLAFLAEQGPGTAELAPFIKPWQFYSFKPIHLRKERLRAPLQRCDALLSVTVPAALTFLTAGEEKISGEALMLAICMWSLGQWVGLQL